MSAQAHPFRVAIVGYGLSAKIFHIPFITHLPEDFVLHGIVQRTPKPDNDAAKDHPSATIYKSFEEMLDDQAVEVVVLCTPAVSHFEMCKAAIAKGKNLVVEKPFVTKWEDGVEIGRLAKEKGVVVAVYQNRRWDGDWLQLKKVVQSGLLGRVVEVESRFDRYRLEGKGGWKESGVVGTGAMFDLGSHLVDQVVSLWGMPKRVLGVRMWQRDGLGEAGKEEEDSFTMLLWFDGGLLVTCKAASVSAVGRQLRFWVRGTKGSWRKEGLDPQEDQLKGGMGVSDKGFGREGQEWEGELTQVVKGEMKVNRMEAEEPVTYVGFYREVAKALKGEGEVPVSAEQAADVIKLIELARESAKAGVIMEV